MTGAKLLNPSEPVRFSPPDQERRPEGERIVYSLKVPTQWDVIALRRALAARGARQVGRAALVGAMVEILEQVPGAAAGVEQLKAYAGEIADYHDKASSGAYADDAAGREAKARAWFAIEKTWVMLKPYADLCGELSQAFASLLGDDEVYWDIYGLEAARKFVLGWENLGAEFRREATGLPDELLARLPPGHALHIGLEIHRLLHPDPSAEKNSGSPSRGVATATSSPTAPPPRRSGRSTRATAGT